MNVTYRLVNGFNESKYPEDSIEPLSMSPFREVVRQRPTLYYRGAMDSIDAAVPLLSLGFTSQSYLLLFQALEVSLKGVLEEMKSKGLAAWMAENPKAARKLANNSREEVLTNIQEMNFLSAFRAASPVVGFSDAFRDQATILNGVRNQIIHRGEDIERRPYYLKLILSCLLPMLDELYGYVLNVSLCSFFDRTLAREILVAARYQRLANDDTRTYDNCISHISCAYFSTHPFGETGMPSHDGDGSPIDYEDSGYVSQLRSNIYHSLKYECLTESPGPMFGSQGLTTDCIICSKDCYVTTAWDRVQGHDDVRFEIKEVKCPHCRLSIDDPLLAKIHYGDIREELFSEDEWSQLLQTLDSDEINIRSK